MLVIFSGSAMGMKGLAYSVSERRGKEIIP